MLWRTKLLMLACAVLSCGAIIAGSACNEHELSPFANSLSAGGAEMNKDGAMRTVDILFVVDNSGSMVEEQRGLNENFSKFLNQLINVKADFRLAAVSTDLLNGRGVGSITDAVPFNTMLGAAFQTAGSLKDENGVDINTTALTKKCASYFSTTKSTWLSNTERFSYDAGKNIWTRSNETLKLNDILDIFRCQGLTGTAGSAVERGLSSMMRSLSSNALFKRPGSLLAVVFVTDENDCSSSKENAVAATSNRDDATKTSQCELLRNIEDSCVVTSSDRVNVDKLELSLGPTVDLGDRKVPLRNVCVDATAEGRDALIAYLAKTDSDASEYIKCPADGCKNKLESRRVFYDSLIEYVRKSNAAYYLQIQPGLKDLSSEDRKIKEDALAREDIIVAAVINRDQGQRYDEANFPEAWCGTAGTQSYRYQLFSEMFNEPIYAPICCRREAFSTTVDGKQESVCAMDKMGELSTFGPVLSAIGRRIGEAVAAICTSKAPVTCIPEECEAGSAKCPCLRGCNPKAYFENSDNAYHVCNEFNVVVGSVVGENMKTLDIFDPTKDYTLDMESTFCLNRTDSPIQIKLNRSDTGRNIVYQFPQRITGQ